MADPLSIIGGIAAIVQISTTVVSLIKSAKDASSDRQKVLAEINATTALCQTLNGYVEIDGTESWAETFKILGQTENGPLSQFKKCLEHLHEKLNAKGATLKWPFNRQSVQEILLSIERQKSLINVALTNDNLRLSTAIHEQLQGVAKRVDSLRISQDRDKRKNALSELTTIDFEASHADIAARRAAGTGEWFLESTQFTSWRRHGLSSILWCPGIPGSGKTILSSLVIDNLRAATAKDPSIGLAGIYCSYRNNQSTVNHIGSIIRQLLEPLNLEPPSLPLTLEKARAVMPEILASYSKVMLVIDALDECEDRDTLMSELQKSMRSISGGMSKTLIHIFVTGRNSVSSDVERILKPDSSLKYGARTMMFGFSLSKSCMNIYNSLNGSLKVQSFVQRLSVPFCVGFRECESPGASSRFLLARLYMDLLCQIPTKRRVSRALDVLPEGIDKTYSEAWHRVCTQIPDRADLGKRILLWIIHATRPLRVQELRHAIAIEDNDEEIDPDGLLDAENLTSFCAGLVVVDRRRGLFSLVHPTTQEYFDKHKEVLFPAGHEHIAAKCITYLCMKPFRDEGALDNLGAFYKRRWTCYLLGYTAVNWGFHAAMADSEKAKDHSVSLLNNEPVRAAAWQALQLNTAGAQDIGPEWPRAHGGYQAVFDASKSFSVAIHIAAYFGLISVVKSLLELGTDVDQLDGTGRSPLHWAIIGKQNKMLQLLLEHGANANAERTEGYRNLRRWYRSGRWALPLMTTAFLDNGTAIKCLLDHGAQVNKRTRVGMVKTALSVALHRQRRSATQVLLENGADVNIDVGGLILTAEHGDLEFLKLAVDAGATNYNVQRALGSAAAASNYSAIIFLVEHGASANGFGEPLESCNETDGPSPEEVQTPLVACAAHLSGTEHPKSFQCFEYLIEAGANVNRVCAPGWLYWDFDLGPHTTALHTAAFHGRLDMVRTLIERGADVNLSLGEKFTALSSALGSEGYSEPYKERSDEFGPASSLRVRATVKLLIEFGADPQFCKDEEIQRIETLLKMSLDDRKMVAALQTLVEKLRYGTHTIFEKESLHQRVSELKELTAKGANPHLYCTRDNQLINNVLNFSEKDINDIDEKRMALGFTPDFGNWRARTRMGPNHVYSTSFTN